MLRSKFKNKANKTKTTADIAAYKKQRNYLVCLNKESKHNYFDSLDTKKVLNRFGMLISLIFSNINTEEEAQVWYCLKKATNLQ